MLWLRQNQIQKKVLQESSVKIGLTVGLILPTLFTIMGECTGSGSGSSCTG